MDGKGKIWRNLRLRHTCMPCFVKNREAETRRANDCFAQVDKLLRLFCEHCFFYQQEQVSMQGLCPRPSGGSQDEILFVDCWVCLVISGWSQTGRLE